MSSSSHAEGFVNAHLDDVWETFKGFGKTILKFWTTIKDVELDGEDEVKEWVCVYVIFFATVLQKWKKVPAKFYHLQFYFTNDYKNDRKNNSYR